MFNNIRNNVAPINEYDFQSMIHDVNYVLADGKSSKLKEADDIALRDLNPYSPITKIMTYGLKARQLLGLYSQPVSNKQLDDAFIAKGVLMKRYNLPESNFVA